MDQIVQFDNISRKVADDLKEVLTSSSKVSIIAASFSIYAYEALKKELESVQELRFLFTSTTFSNDFPKKQQREFYIPRLKRELTLYGSEFEIRLRNMLTQKAIARECANWIRTKVRFKTNMTQGMLNGFVVVDNGPEKFVYMPFNELTTTELGYEKGNNLCQMITRLSAPFADQWLRNFNEIWRDREKLSEVTQTVIDNVESVYRENAPEFVYFITLYNIFHQFLEDISEDVLPNEATGFRQSCIWQKLYDFQKDAALAVINKLEKYNGCILADSVGLGKTYTALAVIKYYENRNKSVLVLCPKKLNDNWTTYKANYLNNPIAKDRLRYDILFHTDLSRTGGKSNGLDLSLINWGNYDLVVIDESHNFRNGGKVDPQDDEEEAGSQNRYQRLMNKVMREGVKTKVLMLSATPVNNRFNDLRNQLQLAYEGNAGQFDELLETDSGVDEIFRQAQKGYNRWCKLPVEERTSLALQESLSFDFFQLLDAVTIARSRKHIEQYYNIGNLGTFPTRLAPISRQPSLTTDPELPVVYKDIYELLAKLNLAIYTPSEFVLASRRHKYNLDSEDEEHHGLSISGREQGIRRLMCVNLLKRLESSVHSFELTLSKIRGLIDDILQKIEHSPNSATSVEDLAVDVDADVDMEDANDDVFIDTKHGNILLEDIDYLRWKVYLQSDLEIFDELRAKTRLVTPEKDGKLECLRKDLENKFTHPVNEGNKKILIFTAFSDTALYLYENIAPFVSGFGLNTALVTGNIEARSTLKLKQRLDFNTVLTLFSPQSKEKNLIFPKLDAEIDVLVATDCISEGQNLQDCDYLINFDIHWNPVRLVQRFGRIDRIGSRNEKIQMVNYWPDMTLDAYIDLKGRVEARMKASVLASTGDDNPLSDQEQNDLDYRKRQLERLRNEVIDMEDVNTGVSIMDLGLNEFRLDLLSYMKDHQDVERSPHGLHAVVRGNNNSTSGVVFVLKSCTPEKKLDLKNHIHPFYLVYLDMDGNVLIDHLSPKELLARVRSLCKGQSVPDMELCRAFNQETKDGSNMKRYSSLLNKAIESIADMKDNNDLTSFLSGEKATLFTGRRAVLDDFELIDFLVVK